MAKRYFTHVKGLGRGGFGVVDCVTDANGTRFARKTFSPQEYVAREAVPDLRKRFVREVNTQLRLGGDHIIPVLDYDLSGESPWFIMPLADRTLEDEIAEFRLGGRPFPVEAICQVLNALELLHELDYVHRDLNPKNVLRHDGVWKLSDLGAVLPPPGQTVTLTADTIIFTERYCAPEQRRDFHKAQSACDVYAFGCILHDFFGAGDRTPYQKHTAQGEVGILIEKCTESNPRRRPTVPVLRTLLLAAVQDLEGGTPPTDETSAAWLQRLDEIGSWTEETYEAFGRFFSEIDVHERTQGYEHGYAFALSTPFLSRLPTAGLATLAKRGDGLAEAIIEKYCEWVRDIAFEFQFSDMIADRLAAIADSGRPAIKAMAIASLVRLGSGHNRWHAMRAGLARCETKALSQAEAHRVVVELQTEQLQRELAHCVTEVDYQRSRLRPDILSILDGA